MSHMDEVRRSYADDINAEWDYGIGFVRAGIASDIEERFGVFPNFGVAGGCVQMVFTLETGHVVRVTDADDCMLTHARIRIAEDGFSVGVYRNLDDDEPLTMVTRHVGAEGLLDMITEAIAAVAGK